jgi:hypothetical protein
MMKSDAAFPETDTEEQILSRKLRYNIVISTS